MYFALYLQYATYQFKIIVNMSQQASISIRVEKDLKQRFYELCDEFGLSAATAFNIFMKAVVREQKIPFEISSETSRKDKYRASFEAMRSQVAESGVKDMTLDEINELIKEVRNERKK